MLILSRRPGEAIRIGTDVTVRVVRVGPGRVRIGIDAPRETRVIRAELVESTVMESREQSAATDA